MEEKKNTPELINACIASINALKKQEDELKKKELYVVLFLPHFAVMQSTSISIGYLDLHFFNLHS